MRNPNLDQMRTLMEVAALVQLGHKLTLGLNVPTALLALADEVIE
jgi:hypothetical protein